jgi:hypothetical protein
VSFVLALKGFMILFLLAMFGQFSARLDDSVRYLWPRFQRPMLKVYALAVLCFAFVVAASYKTAGPDHAMGVLIMVSGFMAPLLAGYYCGARFTKQSYRLWKLGRVWRQKEHLECPPIVSAVIENANPVSTPYKDAR